MTQLRAFPASLVSAATALLILGGCGDTLDPDVGNTCVANLIPGDIVVTEIMMNPPGSDSGSEWIEIYNAGSQSVDLSGLAIIAANADRSSPNGHLIEGLTLDAGQYAVLGNVENLSDVLPPEVNYGYGTDLGDLRNAGGLIQLGCGSTVIDETLYEEGADGASRIFDGRQTPNAVANDDLSLWCDSVTAFGEGFATPGQANDPCYSSTPNTCLDGDTERDVVRPQVGDLLITEIMPNPDAVADEVGEWFEVLVLGDVDLNGLGIGKLSDELDVDTVLGTDACLPVTAGERLLFAANEDSTMNGGLPAVDALLSFSLSNTSQNGTGLVLSWGDEVIDLVGWSSSPTGASWSLDPAVTDPSANDDVAVNFCEGATAYGAGDLGTPGEANPTCGVPIVAGECSLPDGSTRATVAPSPGDLVITEFMANPSAVGDGDGEWLELAILGNFDLNGLELARTVNGDPEDIVASSDCLPVTTGDVVVMGNNLDSTANGGIEGMVHELGFSLINSDGTIRVSHGGTALDIITYTSVADGASTSLSLDSTTADANDDESLWCFGATAYGLGDLGTPGVANPVCDPGLSLETCTDPVTLQSRPIVAPMAGDLVLTEWLANANNSDDGQEWVEVLVNRNIDLNGLRLVEETGNESVITGAECITAAAGDRVLIADANAALPQDLIVGTMSFDIGNSGTESLSLLTGEGVVLDRVDLDFVSDDGETEGAATQVDPRFEVASDPDGDQDNDNLTGRCPATSGPYGTGDPNPNTNLGTPGEPNDTCDGGGGNPGNGECNDNGTPRPLVAPSVGDVLITEFMANPAAVSDGDGEWLELTIAGSFDLNGLELSRLSLNLADVEGSQTIASADCLSVTAGDIVVFGNNVDPEENGGIEGMVDELAFTLVNSNNALRVSYDGTPLDTITYTATDAGESTSLSGDVLTPEANDDESLWCPGSDFYPANDGEGDLGSPGVSNPNCP